MKQLRATLIALLDDEDGISDVGLAELQKLSAEIAPGANDDIFAAVTAANGRMFLSEDHGFTNEQA